MVPHKTLAAAAAAVIGAAVLGLAPGAIGDSGPDRGSCRGDSTSNYKLRATSAEDQRISVAATVFSEDADTWEWKLRHNDDLSASGKVDAKDADRSFRIVRSMIDFDGLDTITFRAENLSTGEICKGEITY